MSNNTNQGLQVVGNALTSEFAGATVRKTSLDSRDGSPTGVQVTFANGLTLSIQWHGGAYSSVGRGFWDGTSEPTFETAAWFPRTDTDSRCPWFIPELGRAWHNGDKCDQVQAYQTLAQVMESARLVASARCRFFEGLAFLVSQ